MTNGINRPTFRPDRSWGAANFGGGMLGAPSFLLVTVISLDRVGEILKFRLAKGEGKIIDPGPLVFPGRAERVVRP